MKEESKLWLKERTCLWLPTWCREANRRQRPAMDRIRKETARGTEGTWDFPAPEMTTSALTQRYFYCHVFC